MIELDFYIILAVVGVGFMAGFINTLAGSGSLLTLPLLMFLGLPANVANGTNRIAILLQNLVGITSFKQQKVLKFREAFILGIPAVVGSLLGAGIAINLNELIMERTIGFLLVVMFFIVILRPAQWLKKQQDQTALSRWLQVPVFFFIGVYGGFIQAGVGFFLLAGLVLGAGFDLVKANAVKVFIIFLYTPFALAIFMLHHQVNYKIGLILAIGNMLGAFAGSRVAVIWGPLFVRWVLLITLVFASMKLLGILERIIALIPG